MNADDHGLVAPELAPIRARLGPEPEELRIDERLEHPPSGSGDHLWVLIKKRGLTSEEAIRAIAQVAAVPARDIGSAGMKDKHAITTQWLSLEARRARPPAEWVLPDGIELLEHSRHGQKLRTGRLAGNRFTLRLIGAADGDRARARAIVERLRQSGLPNYFGAQRFGNDGQNFARARVWLERGAPAHGKRGRFFAKLHPSVLQSQVFNRYLALRAEIGLERLVAGDVVRLDGSNSVFVVDDPERELPRLAAHDIHLTGPMPGPKMRRPHGVPAELEARAVADSGLDDALLQALGRFADGTRRDLLARLDDLTLNEPAPGVLELAFFLPAGSYATELVRQLTHAPFRARSALGSVAMSSIDMTEARDLPPPKLEALIEMMFLAAFADDEFSDAEQAHFKKSVESLTNDRIADAQLDRLLARIKADLEKEGRDARLHAVKERLPDAAARKVALSLAIQVTASDGIIRTSERELILETADALGIDRDAAADLVAQLSPK